MACQTGTGMARGMGTSGVIGCMKVNRCICPCKEPGVAGSNPTAHDNDVGMAPNFGLIGVKGDAVTELQVSRFLSTGVSAIMAVMWHPSKLTQQ
jgi:hypothetical protein